MPFLLGSGPVLGFQRAHRANPTAAFPRTCGRLGIQSQKQEEQEGRGEERVRKGKR